MSKTLLRLNGLMLIAILLLQGCSSTTPKHRPWGSKSTSSSTTVSEAVDGDGPPLVDRDVALIPNAVPRLEPLSRYGNPPKYTALGNRYYVMDSSNGYKAKGTASWYGRKFHGQRTSSGEPYDMFGMTAAHRSLPLPTYAQFKNLDNGREVIVKINDRGPFVGDRIIDLSYAAAKKLGIHQTGTAKVQVTAIDPVAWHKQQKSTQLAKKESKRTKGKNTQLALADHKKKPAATTKNTPQKGQKLAKADQDKQLYIQLGAFSEKLNAQQVAKKATILTAALSDVDVHVLPHKRSNKEIYKVRIGPMKDKQQAQKLQKQLVALNKTAPATIVYE